MNRAEELKILGEIYEENGDYLRARELYGRALQIVERQVGQKSSELQPFLYDLAMINAALDCDFEAKKIFGRLLRLLPKKDPLATEIELVLAELEVDVSAA